MPARDGRGPSLMLRLLGTMVLCNVASIGVAADGVETPCRGDLDGDQVVDRRDLEALFDRWTERSGSIDIDGDGAYGIGDVAIMAWNWDSWKASGTPGRQVVRSRGTTGAGQGFWEYLPADYLDRGDWPLLIFLHGMGENGDGSAIELQRVLVHGPPALIAAGRWPVSGSAVGDEFVVLSPQHSSDPEGCHAGGEVAAFLEWAIDHYDVDPDRVYLTGLSCGGDGIWNYLGGGVDRAPGRLAAAVVPICGDGREAWERRGCDLGRTPIWAFHGDLDDVVPPAGSDVPMRGLAECAERSTDRLRYTVLPGVDHDSWTETYDLRHGHDIYAWLHSHVRGEVDETTE